MSDAERAAELRRKLEALAVKRRVPTADLFALYDGDHDRALERGELEQLLEDADVGNDFTRRSWVNGVLEKLDRDQGDTLTWDEIQGVLGISGPPAPPAAPAPPVPSTTPPASTPAPIRILQNVRVRLDVAALAVLLVAGLAVARRSM